MSGRLTGRLRPMLAVGALSLALVTGCSSSDDADNTSAPDTASSSSAAPTTAGSSEPESSADESSPAGSSSASEDETSAPAGTAGTETSDEDTSAAAPSDAPTEESASAAPPADGSTDPEPEATEGTACGGLTVEAVNGVLTGVTLATAIDITVDASTGDSSCIFGTDTTIDSVVVEKSSLETYLGGELAGQTDSVALDTVAEMHSMTLTDVESADSTIGRLEVRTLTGTDLTGAPNSLSYTVTDGTLIAASVSGSAFGDGLADTSAAVLELALSS